MLRSHSEPVSWLLLERYALGELDDAERRAVEQRLAQRPDDAALVRTLRAPALPATGRVYTLSRLPVVAAVLAAACVMLAVIRPTPHGAWVDKGGEEVALSLVSDLRGAAPTSFVHGERFKVQVTCPASLQRELGVLVFQAGARFEPLARGALRCGENLAVWPGALALDGDQEASVCVVWGAALGRARTPDEVGVDGVCERLIPRSTP